MPTIKTELMKTEKSLLNRETLQPKLKKNQYPYIFRKGVAQGLRAKDFCQLSNPFYHRNQQ